MKQSGLFGLSDDLKRLSANGDPLEELGHIVDFDGFRPILENALAYSDGAKGGRPPYDCVAMFKILILAAQSVRARHAGGMVSGVAWLMPAWSI